MSSTTDAAESAGRPRGSSRLEAPRRGLALAALLALLVAARASAQEVLTLRATPDRARVRACDELVIEVAIEGDVASVGGYQLFLRYPAERFELLSFEPLALDQTLRVAAPAPVAEGFGGCPEPLEDPWDDGLGVDVLAVAAARIDSTGAGPAPTAPGVVVGRVHLRPRPGGAATGGGFSLGDATASCEPPIDRGTKVFDLAGGALASALSAPFDVEVVDAAGAVEGLTCEPVASDRVRLGWSLPEGLGADRLLVLRNGEEIAALAGDATAYEDTSSPAGAALRYEVVARFASDLLSCQRAACDILVEVAFVRGDVNRDDRVNISDPVRLLVHLFQGGTIGCRDAADTNDDGALNLSDAVYLLNYLFRQGTEPPSPFPAPGADPSEDSLDCVPPVV